MVGVVRLDWDQRVPASCQGGAVTIGNFDGVHRGHAELIAELCRQAESVNGPAVALTFDPHPLQLLRPDQFQPVLTTAADRAEQLLACGVKQVVLLRTTPALLQLGAIEFFQQVLQERLAVRALVEGTNFGFGRNREGTVQTLRTMCQEGGIRLSIVPPYLVDGRPVSSSRVRDALVSGAVKESATLLGRGYRLSGLVGTGKQRGRTIGFPTANLEKIETLIPGDGVYAVWAHLGREIRRGAANIGPNPTFGEQARKIEVHLLDFQGDLVGEKLTVEFVDRLRDTRPFAGVEQLIEQLGKDVARAREILTDEPSR